MMGGLEKERSDDSGHILVKSQCIDEGKERKNASRMTLVFLACATAKMLVFLHKETLGRKLKCSYFLDLKIWTYTVDNHMDMVCVGGSGVFGAQGQVEAKIEGNVHSSEVYCYCISLKLQWAPSLLSLSKV